MKETSVLIVIIVLGILFFLAFDSLINQANILETLGLGTIKEKIEKVQEEEPISPNQEGQLVQPKGKSQTTPTDKPQPEEEPEEPKEIEQKEPAKSPYYKKIRILRPQNKTSYRPSLITLRSYAFEGEEINITGWRIRTRQGEFEILQGVKEYRSYGLEKDILVSKYAYIYLIGQKSPLRYQAFRTNKCFGYLKEYNYFYPSVYASCPKPKLEDLFGLTPYCQDYILDAYGCQTPNYSSDLKISTNSKCVEYINEYFNYAGCFNNYSEDEDFLKNYWYVYTKSDIVEPLHDTVYLLDQNGLLVDKYIY